MGPSDQKGKKSVAADASSESSAFIGRKRELSQLHKLVQAATNVEHSAGLTIVSIEGVAGIGKTSCAKEFVQQWREKNRSKRAMVWLACYTDDALKASFRQVTESLEGYRQSHRCSSKRSIDDEEAEKKNGNDNKSNDAGQQSEIPSIIRRFWDLLLPTEAGASVNDFHWAVIFDHIPEDMNPEKFWTFAFPMLNERFEANAASSKGNMILLSSRSPSFGEYLERYSSAAIHSVTIGPLGKDESRQLFHLVRKSERKESSGDRVVVDKGWDDDRRLNHFASDILGGVPFAIRFAAQQSQETTLEEQMDSLRNGFDERSYEFYSTIRRQLKTGVDLRHRDSDVGVLLSLLTYCAPNKVPGEEILCHVRNASSNLEVLHRAGLLMKDASGPHPTYKICSVHQSAMEAVISPMEAIVLLNLRVQLVNDETDATTWRISLLVLPHLAALIQRVEAARPKPDLWQKCFNTAAYVQLITKAARILHFIKKDMNEAWYAYKIALRLQTRLLNRERTDERIAAITESMALVRQEEGQLEEAKSLLEEALSSYRRSYGPSAKHHAIARAQHNLALIYHDQGDLDKAEAVLREVLETQRVLVGEHGPKSAIACTSFNLGTLLLEKGQLTQARSLLEESLAIERASGSRSLRLALVLRSIGDVALEDGNLEESGRFLDESLQILQELDIDGSKSRDMADTMQSSARLEKLKGNFPKAKELARKALAIIRATQTKDTATLIDTLRFTAMVLLVDERDAVDSRSLFNEALALCEGNDDFESERVQIARTLQILNEHRSNSVLAEKLLAGQLQVSNEDQPTHETSISEAQFWVLLRVARVKIDLAIEAGETNEGKKLLFDLIRVVNDYRSETEPLSEILYYAHSTLSKVHSGDELKALAPKHQMKAIEVLKPNKRRKIFNATFRLVELHITNRALDNARIWMPKLMDAATGAFGCLQSRAELENTLSQVNQRFKPINAVIVEGFRKGIPFCGQWTTHEEILDVLERIAKLSMYTLTLCELRYLHCKIIVLKLYIYGVDTERLDLANSLHDLGDILNKEGLYMQARTVHQSALRMIQKCCPTNERNTTIAKSMTLLGSAFLAESWRVPALAAEATRHLELARDMLLPISADNKSRKFVLANVYRYLGNLHRHNKAFDKANTSYEQALESIPSEGGGQLLAELLCEVGVLNFLQDEWEDAGFGLTESLDTHNTVFGKEHRSMYQAMNYLAFGLVTYQLDRQYDKDLFDRGLRMADLLTKEGHAEPYLLPMFKQRSLELKSRLGQGNDVILRRTST